MRDKALVMAGDLFQRITIEQNDIVANDDNGQPVKNWTTFLSTYALVEPISGRAFDQAKSIGSTETHNVTLRYRSGVTTAMRINFKGRYFAINSIQNVKEYGAKLVLTCTENLKTWG